MLYHFSTLLCCRIHDLGQHNQQTTNNQQQSSQYPPFFQQNFQQNSVSLSLFKNLFQYCNVDALHEPTFIYQVDIIIVVYDNS